MKRYASGLMRSLGAGVVVLCLGLPVEASVPSQDQWPGLAPRELGDTARLLHDQGVSGASAAGQLAEHAGQRFLAARQAGEIDWQAWIDVPYHVGQHMSAEARAAMVASLKAQFVDDAGAVARLGTEQVLRIGGAMIRMGAEEHARTVYKHWIADGGEMAEVSSKQLWQLAQGISGNDQGSRGARAAIANVVTDRFAADAIRARSVSLYDWDKLIAAIGDDLPSAQATTWRQAIRSAYAANAASLGQLEARDLRLLVRVTSQTGGDGGAILEAAISQTQAWKTWGVNDLVSVSRLARQTQGVSQAARDQLIGHLSTYREELDQLRGRDAVAYANELQAVGSRPGAGEARSRLADSLSDRVGQVDRTRQYDLRDWRRLTDALASDLDAPTRAAWVQGIRAAFATPSQLQSSEFGEVAIAIRVLGTLGDREARHVALQWLEASDRWKSADLAEIRSLTTQLKALGKDGAAARARIADQITGTHMDSAEKVRAAGIRVWSQFVDDIAPDLLPHTKHVWSTRLMDAFVPDQGAMLAMRASDAAVVATTIARLDHPRAAELAGNWFAAVDQSKWSAEQPRDLASLARLAVSEHNATRLDRSALIASLDSVLLAKHAQSTFDMGTSENIARLMVVATEPARAREWGLRAYQRAMSTDRADVGMLGQLGHLLHDVNLVEPGRGYMEFAKLLARAADADNLYTGYHGKLCSRGWQRRKMAYAINAPEARALVEAKLFNKQGDLRIEVAHILAWAYRYAGDLDQWISKIDAALAQGDLTGDRRAQWLLAKGLAECLRPVPGQPRLAKPYFDQALASARSEAMRIEVVRQFQWMFCVERRYDVACAFMGSIKHQFEDDRLVAQIEDMEQKLARSATQHAAQVAEAKVMAARQAANARLDYYRQRLEAAQRRGDSAAVTRIQSILTELESPLRD